MNHLPELEEKIGGRVIVTAVETPEPYERLLNDYYH